MWLLVLQVSAQVGKRESVHGQLPLRLWYYSVDIEVVSCVLSDYVTLVLRKYSNDIKLVLYSSVCHQTYLGYPVNV